MASTIQTGITAPVAPVTAAAENPNYLFAKMSTVLSFPFHDGITKSDLMRTTKADREKGKSKSFLDEVELQVEKKVREIIQIHKTNHTKFTDPDFGPTPEDPLGAKSLYGDEPPTAAGTNKYPSPEAIRWDRPQYTSKIVADESDQEEEDEFAEDTGKADEVWCMDGELFIDGSSSGDVVQGKLGDCWFLGALSVLGTQEELLKKCFWNFDEYSELGLYVCVFFKDMGLRYVIIDDQIPVFASSGKVVFGQCKDQNELWVPLIEKAYAKLHGCYKALIGGYVHLGLSDVTGYVPRLLGLQRGCMGYSRDYTDDQLWKLISRYQQWECLMGTSIQAKPGESGKVTFPVDELNFFQVEMDVGQGLKMGHAYSFLACGEIVDSKGQKVKLVRLRNPWGFGEWTGPWSDDSPERQDPKNSEEIFKVFTQIQNRKENQTSKKISNETTESPDNKMSNETTESQEETEVEDRENIQSIGNDGTFFMKFEDWKQRFTNLFVSINFPSEYFSRRCRGVWSGDVGGPREMPTWIANPKIKLQFNDPQPLRKKYIYIGLSINDTRLTLGKEYYTDPLYKVGVSFDVVTADDIQNRAKRNDLPANKENFKEFLISNSSIDESSNILVPQAPYMFGSTQIEMYLDTTKEYYIVPSLKNRKQFGTYFITVYSEVDFILLPGATTIIENQPRECQVGNKQILLTNSQFYEKVEEVRERIQLEAKNLNLTVNDLIKIFPDTTSTSSTSRSTSSGDSTISRTEFKRKLIQLGFSLADFPDDDFIVLDEDNNGEISRNEFISFFKIQYDEEVPDQKIEPPLDDLLFQPIDLAGELTVTINSAKGLRKASTWFTPSLIPGTNGNSELTTTTTTTQLGPKPRDKFIFNLEEAIKSRTEPLKNLYPPQRIRPTISSSLHKEKNQMTTTTAGGGTGAGAGASSSSLTQLSLLNIDTEDTELDRMHSPRTYVSIKKGQKLSNPLSTSGKGLKLQSVDDSSLPKIHTDQLLLKTELNRVDALSKWREKFKQTQITQLPSGSTQELSSSSSSGTSTNTSNKSILINRHCFKKKSHDLVPLYPVYKFLGVTPELFQLLFPDHATATSTTTAATSTTTASATAAATTTSTKPIIDHDKDSHMKNYLTLRRTSSVTKYHSNDYDIWDIIIDRVSVISSSRNKDIIYLTKLLNTSINKQYLNSKIFEKLALLSSSSSSSSSSLFSNSITSTIPTPTKTPQTKIATKKGTPSISNNNNKHISGTASVKLKQISSSKVATTITMARDILDTMSGEIQYVEIFRRLISIPLIKFDQLNETICANIISQSTPNFNLSLKGWFEYFDRNGDGEITFDEFTYALNGLNVKLSYDSMKTLFMRFQLKNYDDLIDWNEFLLFYEKYIHQKYIERITFDDEDIDLLIYLSKFLNIYLYQNYITPTVGAGGAGAGAAGAGAGAGVPATPGIGGGGATPATATATGVKLGHGINDKKNLCDRLVTLNKNDLHRNAQLVTLAGLKVSLMIMDRISRVFDYNITNLKQFCLVIQDYVKKNTAGTSTSATSSSNSSTSPGGVVYYDLIFQYFISEMSKTLSSLLLALSSRCQVNNKKKDEGDEEEEGEGDGEKKNKINFELFDYTNDEEFSKLWLAIAVSCDIPVRDEQFMSYIETILSQHTAAATATTTATTRSATAPASAPAPNTSNNLNNDPIIILQRRIFCHLIRDEILHSCWNKNYDKTPTSSSTTTPSTINTTSTMSTSPSTISYTAFKAFIRRSHIDIIEQKLQYLVLLQNSASKGNINYFVHYFLPTMQDGPFRDETQLNHLIMIAFDPISSTIFTMKIPGNSSKMPYYMSTSTSSSTSNKDTNIISTILNKYKIKDDVYKKMKEKDLLLEYSLRFYNPYDTPYEDTLLIELSQRLRLINTGTKTCLLLSEDMKFISCLKEYIQSASLPFFTIVNEVSILFEASSELVLQYGSIHKLIFGSIRKNKPLNNFLMNVLSDLKVLLRTYDGDIYEAMDWKEMLAYLSDHRNPFVTIQLLPEYIEPKEGLISIIPSDINTPPPPPTTTPATPTTPTPPPPLIDDISSDSQSSLIYKGTPDIDGGTHPYWNQTFKIPFQPPKLTNCPILFTDIMELIIDNIRKYIIVMVRIATDKSLFMTAYDPRTSTDYILFGGPKLWCQKDIISLEINKLKKLCQMENDLTIKSSLDIFQKQLDLLIYQHTNNLIEFNKSNIFKLGPAITPRLLISVYNQKNESNIELLGYSQVSISSVLSGTGNKITHWAKLMHETATSSGSSSGGGSGGGTSGVSGNTNQITLLEAGSIQMQLEYTKESELKAIEESKQNAKERRKQSSNSSNNATASTSTSSTKSADKKTMKEEKEEEMIKNQQQDIEELKIQKNKLIKEIDEIKKEKIQPLTEENKLLQEKLEKLKQEMNLLDIQLEKKKQELEKLTLNQELSMKLPLPPTLLLHGELNSDISPSSSHNFYEILHGIINIFINRYKKKNPLSSSNTLSSSQILKPLSRSLHGYITTEKGNIDQINSIILQQLLNDLLIDIDINDVDVIIRSLDTTSGTSTSTTTRYITSSQLMDCLKLECRKLLGSDKETNSGTISRRNSNDNPNPLIEEKGLENLPSESKLLSHSPAQVDLQGVVNEEGEIDWDTYPLPDDGIWERRYDKKSGKPYYLNHVLRSTQWKHPLYQPSSSSSSSAAAASKRKTKRNHDPNQSTNELKEILENEMKVPMNQTVPIRSKNPVNSSKERLEEGNDHLNHTTPTRPMSSTTHNKSQKVRPKQINK